MNRFRRQVVLLLAAGLTTACQGPPGTPLLPALTPPGDPSPQDRAYPWPRSDWWQALQDEQLHALLRTALQDNPGLQITAARIEQAQGLASMAGAVRTPWLGAEAQLSGQRFSADFIQSKLAGQTFAALAVSPLTLRYHLDFWGRDRAALAAAIGTERAAQAEDAQARLLLSTALVRAYIRLRVALNRIEQATQQEAIQVQLQKLSQTRRQRGLEAQQTSLSIDQTLAVIRQRISSDQTETQILRQQLASLAGKDPAWAARLTPRPLQLARQLPIPERLPLSLLGHRADVSAARWRAEAAAQEVKIAHTQFYPDVNLVGFAGFQTVNLTDLLFLGRNAAFAIGPSLTVPLFMGGQLEGNLKQKEAAYHAAVASYNNSLLRALQDTADALTRCQDSRTRHGQQQAAVAAAERQLHLAASLHRAGLNHRGPVLEAQSRALDQAYLLQNIAADQDLATIGLIEALGAGYADTTTP